MKKFKVEYYDGDSGARSSEEVEAENIVEAWRIAIKRAVEMGLGIDTVNEVGV